MYFFPDEQVEVVPEGDIAVFLYRHASPQVQVDWLHKLLEITLRDHILYDRLFEVLYDVPDLLEPALQEGDELILGIVEVPEERLSGVLSEVLAHRHLIVLSEGMQRLDYPWSLIEARRPSRIVDKSGTIVVKFVDVEGSERQ